MRLRFAVVVLLALAGAPLRADVVLWNNGPIVNRPFAGAAGAHASRVQAELGLSSIGFGGTLSTPSSEVYVDLAEDFSVDTPGGWYVSSLTLFSLPLSAPPATGGPVAAQILNGPPWAGGTAVFSGSTSSATPLGAYRVPGDQPLTTTWPISARTLPVGVTLAPGQYWVVWSPDTQTYGFKGQSPPVTRDGQTATGTAWIRTTSCDIFGCGTSAWSAVRDAGTNALQGLPFVIEGRPVSARKGDFDGQMGPDLVLRNVNAASPDFNRNKLWFMDGVTRIGEAFVTPDPPGAQWAIVGTDDFDTAGAPWNGPDGKTDLILRDLTTGELQFWLMNGSTRVGAAVPLSGTTSPAPVWRLVATADFNGDGRPDILWRHVLSTRLVVWLMNGTNAVGAAMPNPDHAVDANWEVVAAQDYNNDGFTDLLWYNVDSGWLVTWYLNGALQATAGQLLTPPAAGDNNWRVVASADYSGTAPFATPPLDSPDVVWRHRDSGQMMVWHLDFTSHAIYGEFTSPATATPALDWTVAGPK